MTVSALFTKHRPLAHAIARTRWLPGADTDDVNQEALIALWTAARNHDPERAPFPAYARLVITRHLDNCLKHATRQKHRALTDSVREEDRMRQIEDTLADPAHRVAALETLRELTRAYRALSELERAALAFDAYDGLTPGTRPYKQVDGARFRARRKLRSAA